MAERKYVHGLAVRFDGDTVIISLGRKEIWDGADLSLFRDTLRLLVQDGNRSIAVDLKGVQHIPSGFFGQLMDCSDVGVSIELLASHPRIRQMLWFQVFFDEVAAYRHLLRCDRHSLSFRPESPERSESFAPVEAGRSA